MYHRSGLLDDSCFAKVQCGLWPEVCDDHLEWSIITPKAVIKSATSPGSLGFAGERPVPHRLSEEPSSWRFPANPRKAVLAADWITASKCLPFLLPRCLEQSGKQPAVHLAWESRDQDSCQRSLPGRGFQAAIQSAASAASPFFERPKNNQKV